ncbi:MAG TPA: hypothetical protein IAC03_03255 [Candidatus Coprenecus pullistercoris]|nr:hypothetical protein [Candidatus Coprenecus pullistercoris]
MSVLLKRTYKVLIAFCAVCLLHACSVYEQGDAGTGRTVIVYMAADNNLASFARRNLDDMARGGVPYYCDRGEGDVLLVYTDISGERPRLMRLSKDRFGVVNTETLVEYEDHNSCSDSVMRSVLAYASSLFPADEYGLVLWSHGTGWVPPGYYSEPVDADGNPLQQWGVEADPYASYVKSFGTDGGYEMDIRNLAAALPEHYTYILIDACLMGGIEVAYELKDCCDYLIVSAAEVLANGFPYQSITGLLFGQRNSLEDICRLYYEHYQNDGATVAMIDTRRLNDLAASCLDIFLASRAAIPALDMDSVQGYFRLNRHWFYDLDDFISRIAPRDTADGQSRSVYDVFRSNMEQAVVCKWSTEDFVLGGYPQFSIKKFSGLSTYIPNPENPVLDEYYKTLAWNKAVMMVE